MPDDTATVSAVWSNFGTDDSIQRQIYRFELLISRNLFDHLAIIAVKRHEISQQVDQVLGTLAAGDDFEQMVTLLDRFCAVVALPD